MTGHHGRKALVWNHCGHRGHQPGILAFAYKLAGKHTLAEQARRQADVDAGEFGRLYVRFGEGVHTFPKDMLGNEERLGEQQRPRDGTVVKVVVGAEERDEVARVQEDHGFLGRP